MLTFVKAFNPDATVSPLNAKIIGGTFAILGCLQYTLLFSPKKEAIRKTLKTAFAKSKSARLSAWANLLCENPVEGLKELGKYLLKETTQNVSNINGGVTVAVGLYDQETLPLSGIAPTIILTYLAGVVFFESYMDDDFEDFFSWITAGKNLASTKFFKSLNVLLEGGATIGVRAFVVYAFIVTQALTKFDNIWTPYWFTIACCLFQSGSLYKAIHDRSNQFEFELKKILSDEKNIRVLAKKLPLEAEQTELLRRLDAVPLVLTIEKRNELIANIQKKLALSFEKLLIKIATKELGFGYVWKEDKLVVIADTFSALVGGWIGSTVSSALFGSFMSGSAAMGIGIPAGAVMALYASHQAEATIKDESKALDHAKQCLQIKTDNKPIPSQNSWKSILTLVTSVTLVMGMTGSGLMSEMGMLDTRSALLSAATAIAIMKYTIGNLRYNGKKVVGRISNLHLGYGSRQWTEENKVTFFKAADSKPSPQAKPDQSVAQCFPIAK